MSLVMSSQACAACKFQRRKCDRDCFLAPYFPANRQQDFLNARRLFGVRNMQKMIKRLDPHQRSTAAAMIQWEANMRAQYPVEGCYGFIRRMEMFEQYLIAELQAVQKLLDEFRRAASVAQTSHYDFLKIRSSCSSYETLLPGQRDCLFETQEQGLIFNVRDSESVMIGRQSFPSESSLSHTKQPPPLADVFLEGVNNPLAYDASGNAILRRTINSGEEPLKDLVGAASSVSPSSGHGKADSIGHNNVSNPDSDHGYHKNRKC